MNVLLGVTGGIAAYKSADLVRRLREKGCQIKVIMTPNATKFVTPLTFEIVSQNKVFLDTFEADREDINHISLADWADLLCIAPATANIVGKMANGIADDLLSTTFLSFEKSVLIAPAMNVKMWENQVVQDNVNRLDNLTNVKRIGPVFGELACGQKGMGRMSSVEEIQGAILEMMDCKC